MADALLTAAGGRPVASSSAVLSSTQQHKAGPHQARGRPGHSKDMTASQKSEIFDNSDKDLEKRVTDLENKLDEIIKLLEKKID